MHNWYLAKIVFGIVVNSQNKQSQFDEQLRLITARDEQEALMKARMIGVREEESFVDTRLNTIQWKFVDVTDLTAVPEWTDGMELHSCIRESEQPDQYGQFIRQKGLKLEQLVTQKAVHA